MGKNAISLEEYDILCYYTLMNTTRMPKNRDSATKKIIQEAVERSAQIEGLSLHGAKENFKVIVELKKHGRAFSL